MKKRIIYMLGSSFILAFMSGNLVMAQQPIATSANPVTTRYAVVKALDEGTNSEDDIISEEEEEAAGDDSVQSEEPIEDHLINDIDKLDVAEETEEEAEVEVPAKDKKDKKETKPAAPKKATPKKLTAAQKEAQKRKEIVNYAKQFVGNPYVYGGTSLTRGTDCSGFTMSVYKKFGINLPRTSSSQATVGRSVGVSGMQPGDLIFYTHGTSRINHVAMYIGNGMVVHASTRKTGIKFSKYNYSKPYKVVSLL